MCISHVLVVASVLAVARMELLCSTKYGVSLINELLEWELFVAWVDHSKLVQR